MSKEPFIDDDHQVAGDFYDLFERDHTLQEVVDLIDKDPDFYDTYLYLADVLREEGEDEEAEELEVEAFARALARISDKDGNWPPSIEWSFHENRHILRALMRQADWFWQNDQTEQALRLYKKLLHVNLNDNLGVRYAITGIRAGLSYDEYMEQVWPEATMPANHIFSWFKEHYPKAADDLEEWKQYCIEELEMEEDEVV